jgi:phage terminase Nu1 subunit (DNA packaging protein)
MKFPEHGGGRRVPAQEVRLVLDHARQRTGRQWAEFFGVHAQTIKAWRARGMVLDLRSGPTAQQWATASAEAAHSLRESLAVVEGRRSR